MGRPIPLPPSFAGMWQDDPRNALPKGRCWNMVDYIPEQLGAWLTERGGWTRFSNSLTAVSASATYVPVVFYAPFSAGAQLLAVDDQKKLIKIASNSSTAVTGLATVPVSQPIFMQDVVIFPSGDGSTPPQKYDGTTVSAISGVPNGQYGAIFASRAWLAVGNNLYASGAGDATTWDTVNSFIGVGAKITGLAALPNVLLVFSQDHTARIRGTAPPPGGDMATDDPIFQYGCTDARSIAVNGSTCAFASPLGVFLTNGTSSPTDLTQAVGLKKYWRDLLSSYSMSTWTLAGGWFGNLYVISVMNGSNFVDCLVFDYRKSAAYRLSNIKARMFAPVTVVGNELYWGSRAETYVEGFSTIFTPGASYKNDGNGTAVASVWETPFWDASTFGSQRWRDVYLDYDLRDAATDAPTYQIGYITSPELTSYTTLATTLAKSTTRALKRQRIYRAARGMGFKLTRANASQDARVYGLGATVYQREGSRLS